MPKKAVRCLGCGYKLKSDWHYCPQCGLLAPQKGLQIANWIDIELRHKNPHCWLCKKKFSREEAAEAYAKNQRYYCTRCGAKQDIPIATVWLLEREGKDLPQSAVAALSRKAGK